MPRACTSSSVRTCSAIALAVSALVVGDSLAAEIATAFAGVERLIAIGGGYDRISADELVLKVEEGLHLPSAARDLETFLHGHLPACDDKTGSPRSWARPSRASR